MAFDHKAYWADKMAKVRRSVQDETRAILKWGRFFEGLFSNDGFVSLQGKERPQTWQHTRSIKERRMRRQVHKDRMRSRMT